MMNPDVNRLRKEVIHAFPEMDNVGPFSTGAILIRQLQWDLSKTTKKSHFWSKFEEDTQRKLDVLQKDLKSILPILDENPLLREAPFIELVTRLYVEAQRHGATRRLIRELPTLLKGRLLDLNRLEEKMDDLLEGLDETVSLYHVDIKKEMMIPQDLKGHIPRRTKCLLCQEDVQKGLNCQGLEWFRRSRQHGLVQAYLHGEEESFLDKLPQRLKKIENSLLNRTSQQIISPGEASGVVAAESVGEPGVQLSVKQAKHSAGGTAGLGGALPETLRLIDASRPDWMKAAIRYLLPLEEGYLDQDVAMQMRDVELGNVADLRLLRRRGVARGMLKGVPTEDEFEFMDTVIQVVLNPDALEHHNLTSDDIFKRLELPFKMGKRNAWISVRKINPTVFETDTRSIQYTTPPKVRLANQTHILLDSLKKIHVSGLRGVIDIKRLDNPTGFLEMSVEVGDGRVPGVKSTASFLSKLLDVDMEGVDKSRIVCNDIFEIYKTLGIEAARAALFFSIGNGCYSASNQAKSLWPMPGVFGANQMKNIDARHILLIADTLTHSGEYRPSGRRGAADYEKSPLGRAKYETPIKHIKEAALRNEADSLKGVAAQEIVGGIAPIGSDMASITWGGLPQERALEKNSFIPDLTHYETPPPITAANCQRCGHLLSESLCPRCEATPLHIAIEDSVYQKWYTSPIRGLWDEDKLQKEINRYIKQWASCE